MTTMPNIISNSVMLVSFSFHHNYCNNNLDQIIRRKRPRRKRNTSSFANPSYRYLDVDLDGYESYRISSKLLSSSNGDNDGEYVDLGSIIPPPTTTSPNSLDHEDSFMQMINDDTLQQPPPLQQDQNSITKVEASWRSNHWIVLIDDEPAIRLAIGDYLHSVGYTCVTACDGPMSFLEMMLWSCSWSIGQEGGGNYYNGEDGNGGGGSKGGEDLVQEEQLTPPWIQEKQAWRLPNCIISDIRMPGGIDGVQLLELLRRTPQSDTDVAANASKNVGEKNNKNKVSPKKKEKRGQPKQGKSSSDDVYDARDEFDLLDAIIVGESNSNGKKFDSKEKITTPLDQAMQYLDAIQGCIDYHSEQAEESSPDNRQDEENIRQLHYPNSLQQVPVILLTAKAMISDRIIGYKAGANGYLPKPFRPEEMVSMVDALMRKQERQKQQYEREVDYMAENANGGDSSSIQDLSPEEMRDITTELVDIKEILQEKVQQLNTEDERIEHERLRKLLPEAIWMFKTGERRKKVFTMEHIRSILVFCFDICLPKNVQRKDMLEELEKLVDQ